MRFFIVIFCLLIIGCAHNQLIVLTSSGSKVEVGKRDPDPGLEEVGPIAVSSGRGCGRMGVLGTYEASYYLLKNRAAELGMTYVQIMDMVEPHDGQICYDNKFTIRGRGFKK